MEKIEIIREFGFFLTECGLFPFFLEWANGKDIVKEFEDNEFKMPIRIGKYENNSIVLDNIINSVVNSKDSFDVVLQQIRTILPADHNQVKNTRRKYEKPKKELTAKEIVKERKDKANLTQKGSKEKSKVEYNKRGVLVPFPNTDENDRLKNIYSNMEGYAKIGDLMMITGNGYFRYIGNGKIRAYNGDYGLIDFEGINKYKVFGPCVIIGENVIDSKEWYSEFLGNKFEVDICTRIDLKSKNMTEFDTDAYWVVRSGKHRGNLIKKDHCI